MKKAIEVTVAVQKAEPRAVKVDLLAIGFFEKEALKGSKQQLDRKMNGAIASVFKLKDFSGKAAATSLLYSKWAIAAQRVLLVGLGDRKKATLDGLRKAAALAASSAVDLKAASLAVFLHDGAFEKGITTEAIGQALAEGLYFGAYRYDEYLSADPSEKRLDRMRAVVIDPSEARVQKLGRGVRTGTILGKAQTFARTLANRPANVISPAALAAEAKKLSRQNSRLRCTILDEKQLTARKMGGILAVGKGSANPPRLIILKYTPAGTASAKAAPLALVGKAITFDSGGISIKPGEGMQDMKYDKSGGIAVLAAMGAIAALKPKRTIYGIIPSAENMPSGKSYRPGDIVTTYSGKTVEIQNTDAEGRMLLCDAIAYAAQLKCSPIVDIATLTGACVVAIGTQRAGLMSNDDKLAAALQKAAGGTGERLWHLPCDDEFVEAMKSRIADLKNTGGKWGGACTAAAFLSQFTGKSKWAHLDIAGVGVWGAGDKEAPGSIGFGVRLLTAFAVNETL
jgi:leucyl aminopeptidase